MCYIYGGDRYLMALNDLFELNLDMALKQMQLQWIKFWTLLL